MTTWRGALRTVAATARRMERESQRQRRDLLKRQKHMAKMEAIQQAALEVEIYENHLSVLQSVHKEGSDNWDWSAVRATDRPIEPMRADTNEKAAQERLDQFTPGIVDRLFRRVDRKRNQLELAIEHGRQEDERVHQEALSQHKTDMADWERMQVIATGILDGQLDAYMDAIRETGPLSDISELGSKLEFHANAPWYLEAIVHANGDDIVPAEAKSLLQSGKLSVKKMPKAKYFEIYQDHICSCVLRVARELFALLPIEMVFVHAVTEMVSSRTGHKDESPILSVAIPRKTLAGLNLDTIDPSDSMRNFVHRMEFMKTKGFVVIEPLKPADFARESG